MSVSNWVSGRVFRLVHGNNLVYNTCWEDPRLDREALQLTKDDTLLVITSAGCNALDYALTGLKHVYAVDMNPRQNALLELKMAGIKRLDFNTFFRLFGEGRLPGVKDVYAEQLRKSLSPYAQKYWDKRIKKFFGKKRKTFYFRGTSGMFAQLMNVYIDKVARARRWVNALLDAETLERQQEVYYEHLHPRFWSGFIRFIMNRDTTLSMLGVPRAQRAQVENQYDGRIAKFVEDCLETVMAKLPIHDNYFWRVYMTGSYTRDCCPSYLVRENFEALKGGLIDNVTTHTNTVEGFLRENDVQISRYVLLDHMDWLSDQMFWALEAEWQAIFDRAAPKTRILWRSGGMETDYIDRVKVNVDGKEQSVSDLLEHHSEQAAELHAKCRVHTYGSFYIADIKDNA